MEVLCGFQMAGSLLGFYGMGKDTALLFFFFLSGINFFYDSLNHMTFRSLISKY